MYAASVPLRTRKRGATLRGRKGVPFHVECPIRERGNSRGRRGLIVNHITDRHVVRPVQKKSLLRAFRSCNWIVTQTTAYSATRDPGWREAMISMLGEIIDLGWENKKMPKVAD